eukprot:309668-Amphidinium_carterae.1
MIPSPPNEPRTLQQRPCSSSAPLEKAPSHTTPWQCEPKSQLGRFLPAKQLDRKATKRAKGFPASSYPHRPEHESAHQ